jgi:hypothetical protein
MAKPVIVNIPHDLGRDEARRRLEGGFGRIRDQIGGLGLSFQERWEGDRLHFEGGRFGQNIAGRIDVLPDSVRIEVDLPWILAGIAEKLQGRMQNEGRLLLGKR